MTNYYRSSSSVYSNSYDRYIDRPNSSTLGKMQQQYWVTKQAVLQKLGRKEDESIVASDAELDAKLELFRAVEQTSVTLQKVIEMYQDKILALSQEENCLGRFLKEQGKLDKTRAGKMMSAAGKSLSYTAQQRLSLRVPLVRLHQEVETFRSRAISDTFITVSQMENCRTEYRGALHWMKDISQELDPDTTKQLEKFRKVQTQVRRTKSKFDKLKIDCLQKIDLLAASRCNMFSHALATYQNTLLSFWKKTSRTMTTVAESFRGFQHYEFSMLKELTEPSRKLAEETCSNLNDANLDEDLDKDRLIFFEEYHDEASDGRDKKSGKTKSGDSDKSKGSKRSDTKSGKSSKNGASSSISKQLSEALLDLDFGDIPDEQTSNLDGKIDKIQLDSTDTIPKSTGAIDLLSDQTELNDEDKDDITLLREILSIPGGSNASDLTLLNWQTTENASSSVEELNPDWQGAFSGQIGDCGNGNFKDFLPSQLLDMQPAAAAGMLLQPEAVASEPIAPTGASDSTSSSAPSTSASKAKRKAPQPSAALSKNKQDKSAELSKWFNLFADLDPLSNPDAVGKSADDVSEKDRNC